MKNDYHYFLSLAAAVCLTFATFTPTNSAATAAGVTRSDKGMMDDENVDIDSLVEYIPGNTNIILSIPHGGDVSVDAIPNRSIGCINSNYGSCQYPKTEDCTGIDGTCKIVTVSDLKTIEIGNTITDYLRKIGKTPHVIICHLKRSKIDMNREINQAAQNNPIAIQVYNHYHDLVKMVSKQIQQGILFDLHGQTHKKNSTELGYLMSRWKLNQGRYEENISSIKSLASRSKKSGFELMAGEDSFGAYLEEEGFRAVPSPRQIAPGKDKYFSGGYITRTYGSVLSGQVDAIQIECPSEVRFEGGEELRTKFAISLAKVIDKFHNKYYSNIQD